MAIPDEFKILCGLFYQRSRDDFGSDHEWIISRVGCLGVQPKTIVKQFLDELLARSPTDAELRRIWQDMSPDYDFYDDKSARDFFIDLRDEAVRQLG